MIRRTIETPVGRLLLVGTRDTLTELHLPPNDLVVDGGQSAALDEAERQLREYFDGRRQQFDLPLDPQGTEFQRQVWAELQNIPFGVTCSYLDVARKVGGPNHTRAVGGANGRNPISIIIPCHRVIAADGSLGGYGGGLPLKERLLAHEGVGQTSLEAL